MIRLQQCFTLILILLLFACNTDSSNPGVQVGNPQISQITLTAFGASENNCKPESVLAQTLTSTTSEKSFGLAMTLSQNLALTINDDNILSTAIDTSGFSLTLNSQTTDADYRTVPSLIDVETANNALSIFIAKENGFEESQDYRFTLPENSITCADSTKNTAGYHIDFVLENTEDAQSGTVTNCEGYECPIQYSSQNLDSVSGTINPLCDLNLNQGFFGVYQNSLEEILYTNMFINLNTEDTLTPGVTAIDPEKISITDNSGSPLSLSIYLIADSLENIFANFIIFGIEELNPPYIVTLSPEALTCGDAVNTAIYTFVFDSPIDD